MLLLEIPAIPNVFEYGAVAALVTYLGYSWYNERKERKEATDKLLEMGELTTEALTKATTVLGADGHKMTREEIKDLIDLAVMRAIQSYKKDGS